METDRKGTFTDTRSVLKQRELQAIVRQIGQDDLPHCYLVLEALFQFQHLSLAPRPSCLFAILSSYYFVWESIYLIKCQQIDASAFRRRGMAKPPAFVSFPPPPPPEESLYTRQQ